MAFTKNIMIVRHRLLTELVKLWRDNELVEKIDRLPIELSPRRSKPVSYTHLDVYKRQIYILLLSVATFAKRAETTSLHNPLTCSTISINCSG